ncbi:hypothetical protein BH10CHL1_BH10CHL1_22040 [soil metagenome]
MSSTVSLGLSPEIEHWITFVWLLAYLSILWLIKFFVKYYLLSSGAGPRNFKLISNTLIH